MGAPFEIGVTSLEGRQGGKDAGDEGLTRGSVEEAFDPGSVLGHPEMDDRHAGLPALGGRHSGGLTFDDRERFRRCPIARLIHCAGGR